MRRLIFNVHLYVGLTVGLLLVVAGLTGSALVWRAEIDTLLERRLLRVEPAATALPVQEWIEAAARAHPDAAPTRVQMPRAPGETAEITMLGARELQVYVDPYRGEVLGARAPDETFANWLLDLHIHLLAGETGEQVMGVAALLLLVLVGTGLVVWWPGLRRLGPAVRVQWRANWKRVNFDAHRAVGFWGTAFLVLTAVTGASLVFHEAFMAGLNRATASPPRPAAPAVAPLPGVPLLPADALLRAAELALPGGEVTYLILPPVPTAPATVRKRAEAELHPSGRNFIYVHPQTGQVLALEEAQRAPAGTRAYNILYPLHIGRWGGWASKIAYTLLGLTPAILFVSGLLMWRNRTRAARRARNRPRQTRRGPRRAAGRLRDPAGSRARRGGTRAGA